MELHRCSVTFGGAIVLLCAPVLAQTTTRVSVDPAGAQVNAASGVGKISTDGRYVTFSSAAANIVASDSNGFPDVFERDLVSGTSVLASVTAGGLQASGTSYAGSNSPDGRFTVFTSEANNLVPGDTGWADVFVRDRLSGAITRASLGSGGVLPNGSSGVSASTSAISADGRFVVFTTEAYNLAPGDLNIDSDVFVRDTLSGVTTLVSVSLTGGTGNALSTGSSITSDGRYVAFSSMATDLVAGSTGTLNVYVRDMQNGVTTWVAPGYRPSISLHGRFVAYVGSAFPYQVFLHDLVNGVTVLVSAGLGAVPGDGSSDSILPSISAGGRYVAFGSTATNLVPGDTNGQTDIFVRDMITGAMTRVSVGPAGQGDGDSIYPSISPDGRFVTFQSRATNLVPGDTNAAWDVFVHDRGAGFYFTTVCRGDGSSTQCPCGNNGSAGNGCANSVNPQGASLDATGTPNVGSDTVVLLGSGMPDSTVLYFQGTSQPTGGAGLVFGDGLRCAIGQVIRLGTATNAGGASQYPEAGDAPVSVKGLVSAGDTRTYQCWYRNAAAFCQPATFNLTNGLQTIWQP